MSVLCIVQARAASSRLPNKVLEPIGELPMLGKILLRLRRAQSLDQIVVATTTDPSDELVAAVAHASGVPCVRGEALDVLSRFKRATDQFPGTDTIVRITADCPFTDPGIVDQVVRRRLQLSLDYAGNQPPDRQEQTFPQGLAVESFSKDLLIRAWRDATRLYEREHVTPWMFEGGRSTVGYLTHHHDYSYLRWTVDTPLDLDVVRLLDTLAAPEPYSWSDVLRSALTHPEVGQLNSEVSQKHLQEVDRRWSD